MALTILEKYSGDPLEPAAATSRLSTPVTWSVQGTIGAQGIQGTLGVQGAQGIIGLQGVQGAIGIQGVQGTLGVQGVQGTIGAQGIQGLSGGGWGDSSISDASEYQILQFIPDISLWENRDAIDASLFFALKTDIPTGVVKEASLGTDFVWVGGLLDVSIISTDASVNALYIYVNDLSTKTSYWKTYVDSSLLTRDNSIAFYKGYIDGSLLQRDNSIANVLSYVTDLSTKTSYWKLYVDGSLQNFIKNSSLGTDFYWSNGNLEVSTALSLLTDVSISNLYDAQAFQYDADNSIWINQDTIVAEDYFALKEDVEYLATTNPSIGTYYDAYYNTWVGIDALKDVSGGGGGVRNTAFGYRALYSDVSGNRNTAIGFQSLYSTVSGFYNTAIGYESLKNNTSGYHNTALGYSAGIGITSGIRNTLVGYAPGFNTTIGTRNCMFGYAAGYGNIVGSYNIMIGNEAGRYISDGAVNASPGYSLYIGSGTRAFTHGVQNEIVIGNAAVGAGSNSVTLGNTSCTSTYLQGTIYADGSAGYTGTVTAGQDMVFKNGILVQVI